MDNEDELSEALNMLEAMPHEHELEAARGLANDDLVINISSDLSMLLEGISSSTAMLEQLLKRSFPNLPATAFDLARDLEGSAGANELFVERVARAMGDSFESRAAYHVVSLALEVKRVRELAAATITLLKRGEEAGRELDGE